MMKKIFWTAALLLVFTCGFATASSINGDFKGRPIVKVVVSGKTLNPEIPAYIEDGSTMLPLKAVSLALGADVQWDANTYTVTVQPARKKLSYDEISKIAKNVFMLKGYMAADSGKQGSAFVINGGYLLSAHHVIDGVSKIEVAGSVFTKPDFDNKQSDVFGIRVNANFPTFTYTTQLPDIGTKVYAVGYPKGNFAISDGVVTSTDYVGGYPTISHTAKTDHGDSGGALINEFGEVIGINGGINESNGTSYAIPISFAQQEIDKLQK